MIIGIDASRANLKFKTGTEWYSYNLIRALARIDNKNEYILYSNTPLIGGLSDLINSDSEEKKDEIILKKGEQTIKSPYGNFRGKILNWPYSYFWTQGRLSLEMIFCRPDVLFIPAHALPIIHPRNSVVTIHDIGFKINKDFYDTERIGPENKKGKILLNFLVKIFTKGKYTATSNNYLEWSTEYSCNKAKKIITISQFSKNEIIREYKIKSQKIVVIYNGYDNFIYKKIDDKNKIEEVFKKYSFNYSPYLLYSGRLEKKKNTPTLIEAFAIMRETHKNIKHKLVLVGKPGFGYDEVMYTIKEFDLENEVIITGWVENEDMPYFYSGASAFILPSFYEGFGIPVLEAMACGVPVIASQVASIPEVAGEAALFFDPNNKEEMAAIMAKIILNNDLRARLSQAGLERVKNFSWDKCARETLEILENL